jgi:hypothetical protein
MNYFNEKLVADNIYLLYLDFIHSACISGLTVTILNYYLLTITYVTSIRLFDKTVANHFTVNSIVYGKLRLAMHGSPICIYFNAIAGYLYTSCCWNRVARIFGGGRPGGPDAGRESCVKLI